jgi:hypothetical protein
MVVNCKKCGVSFEKADAEIRKSPNHFCSRSCSVSFHNQGKNRNPPTSWNCKRCGRPFQRIKGHKSRRICEPCTSLFENRDDLYKGMTIADFQAETIKNGWHHSYKNAEIRRLNRKWNSDLRTMPCAFCGYSRHVELAHIQALASFPVTATLQEVNAVSNIVQLCRNHHWEFDHGFLSLEAIQRQRTS